MRSRRSQLILEALADDFNDEAVRLHIVAWMLREHPAKMSRFDLFRKRMEIVGKHIELEALVETHHAQGLPLEKARAKALREMGCERRPTELRLWRTIITTSKKRLAILQGRRYREKTMPSAKSNACDKFVNKLEASVHPRKEVDWVVSHRKFRKALEMLDHKAKAKVVGAPEHDEIDEDVAGSLLPLTIHDVKNAPNGPAPSQKAVTQLIHGIKFPRDWHAILMGAARKYIELPAAETDDDAEVEVAVDDITEAERLLRGYGA